MAIGLGRIERIGTLAEDKPWASFLNASEHGILKYPDELVRPVKNPLGVDLANGHIPNGENTGVVEIGSELYGIDLVGCEVFGDELFIFPTSKSDVDSEGNIVGSGLVIAGNRNGRVRLFGAAYNTLTNPWYRAGDRQSRVKNVGRQVIAVQLLGWEFPYDFDVKDAPGLTQIIAPTRRIY